jgi:UDP-N-acetylglucosamine--dolichyl-phosphate N-acetylglucosaminephosphotransferase
LTVTDISFVTALIIAVVFLCSYLITLAILPQWIERIKKRGICGKDMNKRGTPPVAELGGVAVIFGFCAAMLAAIGVSTYTGLIVLEQTVLFASLATIVIIGLIGVVDDIIGWKKGIRQWQHALMPLFAALPLMAIEVGTTAMKIPFLGEVNLGILYSLLLVPLGITGASNAFNMLAGFNGLEAGQGIIILGSLTLLAAYTGQMEAVVIGVGMIAALIAFLKYNWFPARVFGGDSLTLMTGAAVAVISIIGNMEKIGVMFLALYFVEVVLKARHRFQSECFGVPRRDGTLKPLTKDGSITQLIMARGRFTEKQVVMIILAAQALICLAVIAISFFGLFRFID